MTLLQQYVRAWLPAGLAPTDGGWHQRHRWLTGLLAAHAVGLSCFSVAMGHDLPRSLAAGALLAGLTVLAAWGALPRRVRACVVTTGLTASSAMLVHLSHGYIEPHFHFFVVIAFVALYHDWLPFLLSLGLITLHHGVLGTLAPAAVYNHPEAILHPWQWAGIHAGFIMAESSAILIYWRLHEVEALELKRSEQLVTSVVENLPDMVFVKDAHDLCFLRLNKAGEELLGHSRGELIGKNDHDFFPQDEADFFTVKDREVLASNRLLEIPEEPVETKHKGKRLLHTKKIPICGADGTPQYLLGISEDITERKQTEQAITDSRARLQAVLDAATEVSIIATDPHGLITLFNTGAERMLGYRAEDIVGKQTPAIIHVKDEVTAYSQTLAARLGHPVEGFDVFLEGARNKDAKEREWIYVHKDGSRLPVSLAVTALCDGQGTITGCLYIAKDISDRKRADEAVRQQQLVLKERLKEAHCLNAMSRLMGDEQLTIDQFVQAVVALLPPAFQHPESICARIMLGEKEFATPAYVETAWKLSAPICDRGNRAGHVEVCDHTDRPPGDENPFLIEECHLIEAVAQRIGDVLTRKQAETALKEQESRLRAIVDHAVDGIITIDERGRIETFNPAAERLFGYPAAEVVGQNVKVLMPEPYQSEHDGYLARYRQTGEKRIIGIGREVVGRRKDGSTFPLELAVSEMHFGDRRCFTGITRDVTDRKAAERKLEQFASQMEQNNLALATAHEQALTATRAKSEFLASMSHEIRTPMNAIVAMADLLQETPLSQEQQEYVGRFSRAATSLLDLINDILDLSKIEAGHLELESIAFDLHDLIDKTAELMAVRAHAKHLELSAFVHPDVPPWVLGDPTRLRQVFVNLVGNAIKFTERGEVVIRIEPDEADPNTLRCSVSDTGIGIPEDKVDSIFDSFTQVDSSTTRKYGGTGLGLSISKRLVELMNGHIEVNSMPGLGSTFSFMMRLPEAPAPAIANPQPVLDIRGSRILVVDDTDTNRLVVLEHLKQFGPLFVEATDGPTALKALDEAQREGKPF